MLTKTIREIGNCLVLVLLSCSLLWGCSQKDVVTLGPGMTEIVFALGQGDRVAATDLLSNYPLEAEALPKLGPAATPNLEALSTFAPSHLFLGDTVPSLIPYCQEHNIQLYPYTVHSIDDLLQTIQEIGTTLSKGRKARGLCKNIKDDLDAIRSSVEEVDRVSVFLSIRRHRGQVERLHTVNGETLISDILSLSGGDNIYADAETKHLTVSIDDLIEKKPAVIIEILPDHSLTRSQQIEYFQDWIAYKDIPAVQNSRIYFVTAQYTLYPGPRVIRTARTLVKHLHPETLY